MLVHRKFVSQASSQLSPLVRFSHCTFSHHVRLLFLALLFAVKHFSNKEDGMVQRRFAARKSSLWVRVVALLVVVAPVFSAFGSTAQAKPNFRKLVGVDLGGVNDRGKEFTDLAKTLRPWETLTADSCGDDQACRRVPLDANGNPTTDARTVFFDVRPFGAWWGYDQANCPLCADGTFIPDVSGTYKLSFNGQARLQAAEGTVNVSNQQYDPARNLTTADVLVSKGEGLLAMQFVDTKRSAASATNTGITNVKLIRPGFPADGSMTFNPDFMEALDPFSTLRFMNWVGGNNINPPYGAADNTLEWAERNKPTNLQPSGEGVAWEYVVELANRTKKDIWINIPIHASNDYILNLAKFMRRNLHSSGRIYLESSNEVWNASFAQSTYNKLQAQAEVLANPQSPLALNAPANSTLNDQPYNDVWQRRNHVQRLVEISQIFANVYGQDEINNKVRVVYAWQIGWWPVGIQYDEALAWVNEVYGAPNKFLYAVGGAAYFNLDALWADGNPNDATEAEIVAALRHNSDESAKHRAALTAVADTYGLKNVMYEGGPDTAGVLQWFRSTQLLERINAVHRSDAMRELILHDMYDNWFNDPAIRGDMFMFFTIQSAYSRWGQWGLTETIDNLQTPKFQAIYELTGYVPKP